MNPALDGRPIILVHLSMTGAAEGLTVCSGEPFRPAEDHEHPTIPRVLCEACRRSARHDQIETIPPVS